MQHTAHQRQPATPGRSTHRNCRDVSQCGEKRNKARRSDRSLATVGHPAARVRDIRERPPADCGYGGPGERASTSAASAPAAPSWETTSRALPVCQRWSVPLNGAAMRSSLHGCIIPSTTATGYGHAMPLVRELHGAREHRRGTMSSGAHVPPLVSGRAYHVFGCVCSDMCGSYQRATNHAQLCRSVGSAALLLNMSRIFVYVQRITFLPFLPPIPHFLLLSPSSPQLNRRTERRCPIRTLCFQIDAVAVGAGQQAEGGQIEEWSLAAERKANDRAGGMVAGQFH